MTLSELLADEERRQHAFPVTRDTVFLAHAAVCPLPRAVQEAVARYADQSTSDDQEEVLPAGFLTETRVLAGRLLNAHPDEVALVGPTSVALSLVANGLAWRPGDNVLVYADDYPANVYPWLALRDRGVEVRSVQPRELGRIEPDDVLSQVDGRTRLVALASCHFVAGWRLDHQTIGRSLHERGVLFCLDGIQTLGAVPTTVEHVDFLAADAHKWLLGPCGAGVFYVRKSLQDQLTPALWGWHNLLCPGYVAQPTLTYRPDARRYEAGTANLLGLVGLRAALELLHALGPDAIAAELQRKRAWLVPALTAKGYQVLHAQAPPERTAGILTFFRPGADMGELRERLARARMLTSLRTDRAGRAYVRLSPHAYNTDDELRRLLERL